MNQLSMFKTPNILCLRNLNIKHLVIILKFKIEHLKFSPTNKTRKHMTIYSELRTIILLSEGNTFRQGGQTFTSVLSTSG